MSQILDKTAAEDILKELKLPDQVRDKDAWVHLVQSAPKAAKKKLYDPKRSDTIIGPCFLSYEYAYDDGWQISSVNSKAATQVRLHRKLEMWDEL